MGTEATKRTFFRNVFAALSVLLYAITHDIQDSSDRKAIIKHLKEVAPDLYFKHGLKQSIVNFLFHNMPYTFISIRSLFHQFAKSNFCREKE